ncbi:hypothetical protein BGP_1682 [Beggiatoa sp. PS]|nr:hypothetical protein BGP_1682 [Beggiatoa sp. PS]
MVVNSECNFHNKETYRFEMGTPPPFDFGVEAGIFIINVIKRFMRTYLNELFYQMIRVKNQSKKSAK